jgi:hypothetical protein
MPAQQERLPSQEGSTETTKATTRPKLHSPPSSLSYLEKANLQHASTETSNTLQYQRLAYEEKASSLRDDKMLAVTDDPLSPHSLLTEDEIRGEAMHEPRHQLTRENLDRHTSDHTLPIEARIKKETPNNHGNASKDTQAGG